MARNGLETRRELRFVCPKCGHDGLQTRNESYIEVEHVYNDGHVEWGFTDHEEVMDYNCGGCGYTLVDEEGKEIVAEDLGEWLMIHCSQEDSEPGQLEDHGPHESFSADEK